MAISIFIPNFAPLTLLYFLLLPSPISSLNITLLLSSYPSFSTFNSLLSATGIAADLASRSSLTILAVPNSLLHSSSAPNLPDVLRYHVLLEYLSLPDLRRIPPAGKLVATLLQTTGRAAADSGAVNITVDSSATITFHSPASNATLLSPIKTLPYNISILSLNSLLIPPDPDLAASETRPPLGLNITSTLINGHDFNVAAAMLAASGVISEFEADEGGAGITMFVPTDEAFADLPASAKFQSLPADRKAAVLRFHVLHSYYPLGSLESIVNPVQPTLATEQNGAGSFTLNISRVNGSVGIDTGIVQASVTQTVFDQNPVAIFGVSRVLLPREFFGRDPIELYKPNNGGAPPPDIAPSPENYGPAYHLSAAAGGGVGILWIFWGFLVYRNILFSYL
ncbi:fasciclin-like arabinogalactan protein 4 [Salvia miltiorrhiza]|uniref:fasciclin-like arabinogalactan protein 4 n=1 Tax=Salvia miltiorrhiza TaxID=226208 RepID=UPI0025AD2781|nr:fasciclin-like arabinogalactan protein 4 [Salvia miltiorrhiza]